jgi:hypothetical protein
VQIPHVSVPTPQGVHRKSWRDAHLARARAMHWGGFMEVRAMTTLHDSTDSRVLGWGALAVAVLLVTAFLMAARPAMSPLGHTVPPTPAAQTRHG